MATATTSQTAPEMPLRKLVGAKTAAALADSLELVTVRDLLYHFPRRYAERGEHTDLSELVIGEQATVLAQVLRVAKRPMRQRRGTLLEVVVGDSDRQSLTLTFFNQAWRERELTIGRWGLFAGKVTEFRGKRQLSHPEYQLLASATGESGAPITADDVDAFAGALIPVYPASGQVPSWVIAQCVRVALDTVPLLTDPLPEAMRKRHTLRTFDSAIRDIHQPETRTDIEQARRRLAFDEALTLQTALAMRRLAAMARPAIPRGGQVGGLLDAFDADIPFQLTAGQQRVGGLIAQELAGQHPMHRLLQGEVGSGKTIVALRAMLQVVDSGGQAALLAPTEVLAAQHARTIRGMLGSLATAGELGASELATRVVLLTGSLAIARRRDALAEVRCGAAGIVVGTHALLQEGVEFSDLGLVVIDEQHRFGVEQRDALRAKSGATPPHVLVMTATPIPRTVAMTVFGDLDVSALTELPQGRLPITTTVVPAGQKPSWLDRVWQRVREEVAAGHQAYIIFPRIGSDSPDASVDVSQDESADTIDDEVNLLEAAPLLIEGPLAQLRTGILHGRLAADEKDAAMTAFAAGELDVLLATTIVEVGLDVPNATMMIIMEADRFGVSQLHQLRGRVGRGNAPGLCLLITQVSADTPTRHRLDAVASTVDGFRLAELDLEQRREGDVLGVAQSGRRSQLKLLSLLRDAELIAIARKEATDLVAADPALTNHPELAANVTQLLGDERAEYLEKT